MSSTLPIFEPKYTSIVLIFLPLPVMNSVLRNGCPLSGSKSDKGFVAAIEKLANVDRPGVLAVGPATLQICSTIDVIIVRTSKSEVVAQARFES
jgi:hypothetical protein